MRTRIETELLLKIGPEHEGPIYLQVERGLRDAVRSGRLRQGTPLPSTRTLARDLRVSRGVIVEAYEQLIAEGYLEARTRAHTVVAAGANRIAAARRQPPPVAPRFDFRAGIPDLGLFPRQAWMRAVRRALRDLTPADLSYNDAQGTAVLREGLSDYLRRVRGVQASPESMLICNGFTQALGLTLQVLRARGLKRLALEDPCHPDVWRFAADNGVVPVGVAVDEHGLMADRLERAQAQAVLLTPAHQFPLGGVLPADRRQQVLAWARRHQAFVIEDDYDAEYRYNRQPVGAMQGVSPDRVIYIGSASKILAPALRLGWLAAPSSLLPALAYHKRFADFGSPLLEQMAYAEFLRDGSLDRHLRRMRIIYRRRRDTLIGALARRLPAWRPVGEAAGLHLVMTLPPGFTEQQVVQKAAARSIRVYPMRDYSQRRMKEPALVFGYGFLTEEHIERGIGELAMALS